MGLSQYLWSGKRKAYVIQLNGDDMEPGDVIEYLHQREDFLQQADKAQATINKLEEELRSLQDVVDELQ